MWRNCVGVAVGVLAVSGCGTSAAIGTSPSASPFASTSPPVQQTAVEPPRAATGGIGSSVRDGELTFMVSALKSARSVSDGLMKRVPQGLYAGVVVTVTNVGSDPATFDLSLQRLHSRANKTYAPDALASIVGGKARSAYETINPGNAETIILAFDAPRGTELTTVELHESHGSLGAYVSTPNTLQPPTHVDS